MGTKLIRLSNDILVEIDADEFEARHVSASAAEKVSAVFDDVRPLLLKICRPLADAWRDLRTEVAIKDAEVELSFGFEAEGNVFVAKSKGTANLKIKLTFDVSGNNER